jgi:formylglycine-generating enzyme required for sulfatase activity
MTNVSLRAAQAFAAWRGKRLPTEEEWMVAASLGQPDRVEGTLRVFLKEAWNGQQVHDRRVNGDGPGKRGERKPNAWGAHDLLGNVWELCLAPEAPSSAVLRGGDYTMEYARARPLASAQECDASVGFRCARSSQDG